MLATVTYFIKPSVCCIKKTYSHGKRYLLKVPLSFLTQEWLGLWKWEVLLKV